MPQQAGGFPEGIGVGDVGVCVQPFNGSLLLPDALTVPPAMSAPPDCSFSFELALCCDTLHSRALRAARQKGVAKKYRMSQAAPFLDEPMTSEAHVLALTGQQMHSKACVHQTAIVSPGMQGILPVESGRDSLVAGAQLRRPPGACQRPNGYALWDRPELLARSTGNLLPQDPCHSCNIYLCIALEAVNFPRGACSECDGIECADASSTEGESL